MAARDPKKQVNRQLDQELAQVRILWPGHTNGYVAARLRILARHASKRPSEVGPLRGPDSLK